MSKDTIKVKYPPEKKWIPVPVNLLTASEPFRMLASMSSMCSACKVWETCFPFISLSARLYSELDSVLLRVWVEILALTLFAFMFWFFVFHLSLFFLEPREMYQGPGSHKGENNVLGNNKSYYHALFWAHRHWRTQLWTKLKGRTSGAQKSSPLSSKGGRTKCKG